MKPFQYLTDLPSRTEAADGLNTQNVNIINSNATLKTTVLPPS